MAEEEYGVWAQPYRVVRVRWNESHEEKGGRTRGLVGGTRDGSKREQREESERRGMRSGNVVVVRLER